MATEKDWKPKPISKPSLLFVEGNDEVKFFGALLKTMSLDNIQVIDVGGKNAFSIRVPLQISQRGFNMVTQLGIIRDADEDVESAFESVKTTLANCKTSKGKTLEIPNRLNEFFGEEIKVGVFIMPDNYREDALEDLCLDIIKEEYQKNLPCVDDFVTCLDKKPPSHQISKVKVQALLASIYQHEGKAERIDARIGVAAERGYWNFESQRLAELKNFLLEFSIPISSS